MKLMTDRCSAANDSMFLLPSRSFSPNAYCAPLVENKMRASVNVIHPRSSGGNADKERASVVSLVPSSFVASGGAAASAPNSIAIKLLIPILEDSCGLHQRIFNGTAIPALHHMALTPMSAYRRPVATCRGGFGFPIRPGGERR